MIFPRFAEDNDFVKAAFTSLKVLYVIIGIKEGWSILTLRIFELHVDSLPQTNWGETCENRETVVSLFRWNGLEGLADFNHMEELGRNTYQEPFWDVVGNETIRSVVDLVQEQSKANNCLCCLVPNRVASVGEQYSWETLRLLMDRRSRFGNYRYLLVDGIGPELNLGIPMTTKKNWQEYVRRELNDHGWQSIYTNTR